MCCRMGFSEAKLKFLPSAADSGSNAAQMTDFFGCKSVYSTNWTDCSEAKSVYSTNSKERSEAKSVYSTNSKNQSGANSAYSRNRQDRSKKNELYRSKTNRGVIFKTFMEPSNLFQGIDSASQCPGRPVQQPYSSSVPSPLRLF